MVTTARRVFIPNRMRLPERGEPGLGVMSIFRRRKQVDAVLILLERVAFATKRLLRVSGACGAARMKMCFGSRAREEDEANAGPRRRPFSQRKKGDYFHGSSVLARRRSFQRDELAGEGRTEDSRSHLFGPGEAEGSLGTHAAERNDGPAVMQRALTEPFLPPSAA
jgi:hypothetical protein